MTFRLALAAALSAIASSTQVFPQGDETVVDDVFSVKTLSKYAYTTLLCDPAETEQADYVRMLLVLKESIRKYDEENDVVAMIRGAISEEQWNLLESEGIKLVQVGEVGIKVSDPEPLRAPDDVSACFRSKLNALKLTEYEKVVYINADALVKQDPRFMFERDGFFAYEGNEAPLNSALFAVTPSEDAFNDIENIFSTDSFHPENGWMNFGEFPHWRLEGHKSDWSFWGAHSDQGMLYYYYDKVQHTATILPRNDGAEVVTLFAGWSKPMLHTKKQQQVATESRESLTEWNSMWKQVKARVDSSLLESSGLVSTAVESNPVEQLLARTKKVMRNLQIYESPAPTAAPTLFKLNIQTLSLIDFATGEVIMSPLADGDEVVITTGTQLTIRAESAALDGDSVKWGLDDNTNYRKDSKPEFLMNRDGPVDEFVGGGTFTVMAQMFEQKQANGLAGKMKTVSFTIVEAPPTDAPTFPPTSSSAPTSSTAPSLAPTIPPSPAPTDCEPKDLVSIFLYDAVADTVIGRMGDIDVIDLCEITTTALTIIGEPRCDGEFFDTIKFTLKGGPKNVKNKEADAPFSLGGDVNGVDFNAVPELLVEGDYKLIVNPTPGDKQRFEFSVVPCVR